MTAPYVCLRCSPQLIRWNTQRRSSGFVSLGQLIGHDEDSKTTPHDVPLANGERGAVILPRRKQPLSFAQKYREQRKPKAVDKVLETLFASNRESEQATKRSRYSRTPQDQPPKDSVIQRSIEHRLREVQNNLRRGTLSFGTIWKNCESLLGEKKRHRMDKGEVEGGTMLPEYTPTELHVLRDILMAICQKQHVVGDDLDVTPADVIVVYMKHDAMRDWWHNVLWCQLGNVLRLRYQSTDPTVGADTDRRLPVLMRNVLRVWHLYMGRYGSLPSSVSVPLTRNSEEVFDKSSTPEPFLGSSPAHLRVYPPNETTVAAAMTLECLTAAGMESPLPIASLFGRLGPAVQADRSIAMRSLLYAGVSPEIAERALEGWKSLSSSELEEILEPTEKPDKSRGSKDLTASFQEQRIDDLDWSEKGLRACLASIDGASKRADMGAAISLWRHFKAHFAAGKSEDRSDPTDQLYARFLRTFWAMRRYDHAIEVWNHMINAGYLPNQTHWIGMLTGCIRAQDVDSLPRLWTKMLQSGMAPDTTAWTTYIYGLIVCREWGQGLTALENLGRLWNSAPPLKYPDTAAQGTTGTHTADDNQSTEPKNRTILRPDIQPVNAALSALIRINRHSLLPRVLAWAQSHRIPLTTYTFNILLRPLVRRGSQAAIDAHLQKMDEANCVADIVTFSIILNGRVSNPTSPFHKLAPEAQESNITSILAAMASRGIEPNPFTYATLLDGLLTLGSKDRSQVFTTNVPAARAILAHMAARDIHPSPHIYTILVEHYFHRRPVPDLAAISSLWSSIRHSGQTTNLDNIFYDRLIEGYARNDEVEEMLKFLRIVPEEGKSPGWQTLVLVMRTLITNREWGRCAEVIEDVEREGGLLRHGQGRVGGRDRAEFWELAGELRAGGFVGKKDDWEQ